MLQPLQNLIPTSKSCYLVEWKGRSCVIDEKRRPQNGDTVLLDMSGMYEWAMVMVTPRRVITDDELLLQDDLLEDIAVVGVVTHEVTTMHEDDRPTI
jgi:hypothetical protein